MKNYGILKFKNATVDNFTSDIGIKLRKKIKPALRVVLEAATKGKLIVDNYPKLEKGKSYIFVSTHNFVEDTIANLASQDRDAYLLFGTSDQLEINKEMYAAWANGFIYVNRLDDQSRKDAIRKMKRVLDNDGSVLIFPEGGFNNTENLLVQRLFASPYILSKDCNVEVVPVAPYHEVGSKNIYINYGEPIKLYEYETKEEALTVLRDSMATLLYEELEKHAPHIVRSEMSDDPRFDYMEERKEEYYNTKWTKDVFDEELTRYYDAKERERIQIMSDLSNVKITKENAYVLAPVLVEKETEDRYDLKKYMHKTWKKR